MLGTENPLDEVVLGPGVRLTIVAVLGCGARLELGVLPSKIFRCTEPVPERELVMPAGLTHRHQV